jgi:hypothetical protein
MSQNRLAATHTARPKATELRAIELLVMNSTAASLVGRYRNVADARKPDLIHDFDKQPRL